MKKVTLRLQDLRVSSFQTSADEAPPCGTVHAAQQGVYPTAVYHSCPPGATGAWCYQLYEDTDMRMCCTVERCSEAGMCW